MYVVKFQKCTVKKSHATLPLPVPNSASSRFSPTPRPSSRKRRRWSISSVTEVTLCHDLHAAPLPTSLHALSVPPLSQPWPPPIGMISVHCNDLNTLVWYDLPHVMSCHDHKALSWPTLHIMTSMICPDRLFFPDHSCITSFCPLPGYQSVWLVLNVFLSLVLATRVLVMYPLWVLCLAVSPQG